MRRAWPLLILLGVPVLALAISVVLTKREGEAFVAIKMGAPEADVTALLGEPDTERPCGENLWWGGDAAYLGKNDGRCVYEVRYEHFLGAYGVGYSKDRHVVSKYEYVSE